MTGLEITDESTRRDMIRALKIMETPSAEASDRWDLSPGEFPEPATLENQGETRHVSVGGLIEGHYYPENTLLVSTGAKWIAVAQPNRTQQPVSGHIAVEAGQFTVAPETVAPGTQLSLSNTGAVAGEIYRIGEIMLSNGATWQRNGYTIEFFSHPDNYIALRSHIAPPTFVNSSRELTLSDNLSVLIYEGTEDVTLTLGETINVDGFQVIVYQLGVGSVTFFLPEGSDIDLASPYERFSTDGRGSSALLCRLYNNQFVLSGNLA